jgi:hypothetical protein
VDLSRDHDKRLRNAANPISHGHYAFGAKRIRTPA